MTFCVIWQKREDADALGYIALHNLPSYMKPCLVVSDLLTRNSNGSQIDWRSFAVVFSVRSLAWLFPVFVDHNGAS